MNSGRDYIEIDGVKIPVESIPSIFVVDGPIAKEIVESFKKWRLSDEGKTWMAKPLQIEPYVMQPIDVWETTPHEECPECARARQESRLILLREMHELPQMANFLRQMALDAMTEESEGKPNE